MMLAVRIRIKPLICWAACEVAGQLAGLDFLIDLEEFLHTNVISPVIVAHQDSKNYDSSFL